MIFIKRGVKKTTKLVIHFAILKMTSDLEAQDRMDVYISLF